jgi:hypothetical protein
MKMARHFSILLSAILLSGIAFSASAIDSPFIENMPKLTANADDPNLMEWTMSGVKGSHYGKLMIPQPNIFLSEKNKYKGVQPDQMKLFADRVAMIFTSRMGKIMEIVDKPGEGVLVLNMAITELQMKKKRGILGYTPIGAVVHATQTQNEYEDLSKLAEKILLTDARLEIEMLDGVSGERKAIRILTVEGKAKEREEKSWEALGLEIRQLADKFYTSYEASLKTM